MINTFDQTDQLVYKKQFSVAFYFTYCYLTVAVVSEEFSA